MHRCGAKRLRTWSEGGAYSLVGVTDMMEAAGGTLRHLLAVRRRRRDARLRLGVDNDMYVCAAAGVPVGAVPSLAALGSVDFLHETIYI